MNDSKDKKFKGNREKPELAAQKFVKKKTYKHRQRVREKNPNQALHKGKKSEKKEEKGGNFLAFEGPYCDKREGT